MSMEIFLIELKELLLKHKAYILAENQTETGTSTEIFFEVDGNEIRGPWYDEIDPLQLNRG